MDCVDNYCDDYRKWSMLLVIYPRVLDVSRIKWQFEKDLELFEREWGR